MNEFQLIQRFFTQPCSSDVIKGIGDDAAVLQPNPGMQLHISSDMLVAQRHFFTDVAPYDLGYKTLAVNLSDMAAMGATPRWALLSVALPEIDEHWMQRFSDGFLSLARAHKVELIGGDTTRGSLTLSVTILGETPIGKALYRSSAQSDDDIWVSGELGLGAIAVQHRYGTLGQILPETLEQVAEKRLNTPEPRVVLGQQLLAVAHAAADISDGLLADLAHICVASHLGATVWAHRLPSHPLVENQRTTFMNCLAAGGDDYELLFTAPQHARSYLTQLAQALNCRLTRVGIMTNYDAPQVRLVNEHHQEIQIHETGYDHFARP